MINNTNLIEGFQEFMKITDSEVVVTEKKFGEVFDIYEKTANIDLNTVMYKVEAVNTSSNIKGSMNLGMTYLYPLSIHGEFNMTRGHRHDDEEYDEVYICVEGKGLLLLSGENEILTQDMYPGSIHYITGKLAHRCVNVGEETLVFFAVWSPNAGYNYNIDLDSEFPIRLFKDTNDNYNVIQK